MDVADLFGGLNRDFYTGVPDSHLKALCNYLMENLGISARHVIAANEGNSVALAAGYHLATGKIPVVYMQNSGIGNAINPIASLLSEKVYGIPCIFIIGWRGEPGIHDEPQHAFQGEISLKLLEDAGLRVFAVGADTGISELKEWMRDAERILEQGGSIAFLVRKNAFSGRMHAAYRNPYEMARETVMERIAEAAGKDAVVATTGKISRELYEIRERRGDGHKLDFLTVGSMGHNSSIALGIALSRPDMKVWCIDGDGAALMHMGAMAVIGNSRPPNMIHIVINNEAHETVGGMPTAASSADLRKIAEGCGYPHYASAETYEELDGQLAAVKSKNALSFLEVKCAIGSRADLGRPEVPPKENKKAFMEYLKESCRL